MSRPAERAPQPETDPLRVWFRFVRLNRRVTQAIGAELKAIGLSIPQFDLISTLTEREGLTQQELAERLYVTKGNVSGLVDRLVEAGLVERRALEGRRRPPALNLAGKERELAGQAVAAQQAYVRRTRGRLPHDDLAELERVVVA